MGGLVALVFLHKALAPRWVGGDNRDFDKMAAHGCKGKFHNSTLVLCVRGVNILSESRAKSHVSGFETYLYLSGKKSLKKSNSPKRLSTEAIMATIIVAPITEPNPQAMPPMKLAIRTSLFLTPWLAVSFLVAGRDIQ